MPSISTFYGIIVYMYAADDERHHEPHIHVKYQDQKAVVAIKSRKLIRGKLPIRAIHLVREWIEIHEEELMLNWKLSINKEGVNKIKPLK